jgi:hypothetical protein
VTAIRLPSGDTAGYMSWTPGVLVNATTFAPAGVIA